MAATPCPLKRAERLPTPEPLEDEATEEGEEGEELDPRADLIRRLLEQTGVDGKERSRSAPLRQGSGGENPIFLLDLYLDEMVQS